MPLHMAHIRQKARQGNAMLWDAIQGNHYNHGTGKDFSALFYCVGLDRVVLGHTSMSLEEKNLSIATWPLQLG